jgi:hypothetical protein
MIVRARCITLSGPVAVVLGLVIAQTALAHGDSTAPARRHADYTARAVCGRPAAGRARCMALQLVPRPVAIAPAGARGPAAANEQRTGATPQAETEPVSASPAAGEFGLRPQDLHSAYELPTSAPNNQTIALVDAYNDPNAEADLGTYSSEFALPACTAASKCFTQVNQQGESANLPFPKSIKELETFLKSPKREQREQGKAAVGWSLEISLDIETVHAVCQSCHIVLVDANSEMYGSLETAESTAARLGAGEISNSWGGAECFAPGACQSDSAFNHPGIVITAATGDEGYLNWLEEPSPGYANFPATSPDVVAVGGTRLELGPKGRWGNETVWNDGGERRGVKEGEGATGGGCSAQFAAPAWQQALADWPKVGCGEKRAAADIAADGDPYTGVAVYDSIKKCPYLEGEQERESSWCAVGGTSLGSPLIAATFALAGGANGIEYPAETLYENSTRSPASLHDVTEGSSGECAAPFDEETGESGCTAGEEAKTSCPSRAICLARSGYDGPTGLGTPAGVFAFVPHREPTVTTGGASEVAQTTATLHASVDPNGREITQCRFEYGEKSVFEASVPCTISPGSGVEAVNVEAPITGLSALTSYRFRIVASNSAGTSRGETVTFATLPEPPTVTSGAEPSPGATSATLYATVNPNGAQSECEFEYGLEASGEYEASTPCTTPPGSADVPVEVSGSLTGLEPDAAYQYRLVAHNSGGTSDGARHTFDTLASAPTVTAVSASAITQTSATLSGVVNPNGEPTECTIDYGPTSAHGSSVPCNPASESGGNPTAVSATITGLSAGTTYYFCVSAKNALGANECAGQRFTTQLPTTPGQQPLAQEQALAGQGSTTTAAQQQVAAAQRHEQPRLPDAALVGNSLTVTPAGVLSVRVSCPATEIDCAGTVTLRMLGASATTTTHHAGGPKAANLTLARGAFSVPGGRVATVTLHLSLVARVLLAHTRGLRVRAVIFARDPAGATHTARTVVSIRMAAADRGDATAGGRRR